MEPKDRVELIEKMASALEELVGKTVEIRESISRDENRGFDRHCTVDNRFQLVVGRVGWQMSGGHFYLHGESAQYGINTGQIASFMATATEITITEKYEAKTIRRTTILPSA